MRECGVQAVRIGEFAWALMEPKEGTFDFSLFDRAIAVLRTGSCTFAGGRRSAGLSNTGRACWTRTTCRARYEDFKREGAEVNKVGAEIFSSRVISDLAVLRDFESQWAYEHQLLTGEVRVPAVYTDLFRAASEQKYNIDFIGAGADFNRYKIIFAPYQLLMDEQLAAKMRAFVEQGGTLIRSAHSGAKDRDNAMTDQMVPIIGLRELFGVEVDSFHAYQPPSREKNALRFSDGASVPVHVFAELLKPQGATVPATRGRDYLQGIPAVTENKHGRGKAVYYGSFFNLEAARYLLARYAKEQNLTPLFADLPKEIHSSAKRPVGVVDFAREGH